MAQNDSQNAGIRYLNPPTVEVRKKKYCRFKKAGIKYVDYKDPEFLKKFLNEQGKIIEAGGLVLDRISQLTESPVLFVHNFTTIVSDELGVLCNRFLHLLFRQNGSSDENGLVLF